jgi:solute carrier family 13 (sodium-dependent dicarboxylate transporter), member 2/3/5
MKNTSKQDIFKKIGLISGLLVFIFVNFFLDLEPGSPAITATLAVALLMAIWWVTEAVPISVTALLPVVLFPLLGIMNGKVVSSTYFNHIIFLFLGGFLMAGAMEKHGLHKRIALKILLFTGSGYGRILFGFMFATVFLSAWMSNTATAMMMVPVVLSVITKLGDYLEPPDLKKITYSLLFGVAYGASIGGISTLIGTPPNLSFARIFNIIFPAAPEITFSQWMIFALPITVVMFVAVWLLLYFKYKPKKGFTIKSSGLFKMELSKLGKTSYEEKIVFIAFITLALLWVFRSGFDMGNFSIPGWSSLLNQPKLVNDGTVAILISGILFMIPTKDGKTRILEADAIKKLPWNIVLLFGGGFALASGFAESGLAIWFGDQMKFVGDMPIILTVLIIVFFMSFLTELTSNTASTEMFLPILAGIGISTNINPMLFMIPATVAASLAFMLPVATPPNAVVFGTGKLKISEMMRTGFILNIIGVIVVTLGMYYWGQVVFDIDFNLFPDWAK